MLCLQRVDIPRAPTKHRKRYVQAGIAAGGLVLITMLFSSLKPAAPSVDREVVSLDGVRRGSPVDFWNFSQNSQNTLVIGTK